jgi:hypothetical protein
MNCHARNCLHYLTGTFPVLQYIYIGQLQAFCTQTLNVDLGYSLFVRQKKKS